MHPRRSVEVPSWVWLSGLTSTSHDSFLPQALKAKNGAELHDRSAMPACITDFHMNHEVKAFKHRRLVQQSLLLALAACVKKIRMPA